jgi:PAS domain S-box-containing protein
MNADTHNGTEGYMRVLIVDHDQDRLRHNAQTFQTAGYNVFGAASGSDCLEVARSKHPDLILVDPALPDTSGIDLVREIKRDPALSTAWAVLWFSPGTESTLRARALERGADACLERALPTRELLARVEAMLRRKGEEQVLQHTLEQWKGIFDAMSHAIYLVDMEYRIVDCNLALADLLEKPPNEIIGQSCYELMHGTLEPFPSCVHQEAVNSRRTETLVAPLHGRWFQFTVSPLSGENQEIVGTVHVLCDITEQRRCEQEQEQKQEQLQDQMSETQTALDRTTEQLHVEMEARQEAEQALSQAHTKLEKQAQEHLTALSRVQEALQDEQAQRQRLEEELARAQTEIAHGQQAEESLSQLRAEMEGQQQDYQQEVARSTQLEAELAEARAELEKQSTTYHEALAKASEALQEEAGKRRQVEESLGEVRASLDDTEQALQAEAEAVRQEKGQRMEAIGLLAGGVAQQFNELLADILGRAEVGLSQLEPSYPAYDELSAIQRTARRGTEWTRRLSTIQRKELVQPQLVDLNKLIANLNKVLRRLTDRDADLELKLAAELPGVSGDANALEHLLMNLVENAQVMMPEGGVLSIETAQVTVDEAYARDQGQAAPGEYVRLRVEDTGPGIEEQVREHLFEPFFLASESGHGLGLKLAEVYGVVRQHGGWIEVDSFPDEGSRFDIYLPVSEA